MSTENRKQEASEEERQTILNCLKEGRVEFENPGALDRMLGAMNRGEPFDWTITDVSLYAWRYEKDGEKREGFTVGWVSQSAGNGEVSFRVEENGKITCDSETMPKEFVKTVLNKLVEVAEFE